MLHIVKIIIVPAHAHRAPDASAVPLIVPLRLPSAPSLHAAVVALPNQGAGLREAVPLRVVAFFFADDDFFGLPVPLVAATESAEIVEASTVEWIT